MITYDTTRDSEQLRLLEGDIRDFITRYVQILSPPGGEPFFCSLAAWPVSCSGHKLLTKTTARPSSSIMTTTGCRRLHFWVVLLSWECTSKAAGFATRTTKS